MEDTKFCSGCQFLKVESQFNKNRSKRDGLSTFCKTCNSERCRIWNAKLDTKILRRRTNSIYQKSLVGRFHLLKSTAARRGIKFLLDFGAYVNAVVTRNGNLRPCHYCGKQIPPIRGGGLDRYNNKRGYTVKNVVPCCWICNSTKSGRSAKWLLRRMEE